MKIATVGYGWVIKNIWAPAFKKTGSTVDWCFDPYLPDAARGDINAQGVHLCESLEAMLACGPDLVIVANPNVFHVDTAIACAQCGVPVLVEKPICLSSQEAKQLSDAFGQKVPFFASQAALFRHDVSQAIELLASSDFGSIIQMSCQWVRSCGVPRPGGWFTHRALSGGGVLVDLGWHLLDVVFATTQWNIQDCCEFLAIQKQPSNDVQSQVANWHQIDRQVQKLDVDVEVGMLATGLFGKDSMLSLDVQWIAPYAKDQTLFIWQSETSLMRLETTFGLSPNRVPARLTLFREGSEETIALPKQSVGEEYDKQAAYIEAQLSQSTVRNDFAGISNNATAIERIYRRLND